MPPPTVVQTVAFEAGPGGGNPCPVVFGGDGLSDEQMRDLAREYGHETAFVLPPSERDAALRLRYFVPRHEMEMCGHATVATLTVLADRGLVAAGTVGVQTPVGVLRCEVHPAGWVTVPLLAPSYATRNPSAAEVAACLGVPVEAIGDARSVSCSLVKLIVPLPDAGTLHALRPDPAAVKDLCERYDTTGLYPFAAGDGQNTWHARQFPRDSGYPEDAATGVAAGALAAYLALGNQADGWQEITVHQGEAMGRPSTIHAAALRDRGAITASRIVGTARIIG